MAPLLRPLGRRAWWRLWDERSSSGDLRSYAPLVRSALPCDLARIFSAGKRSRDDRILAEGAVGSRRDALLPDIIARRAPGDPAWESSESSAARGFVF